MKDFAVYLLSHIVDAPESIQVDESESETGSVTLLIKVAPEDMGRVIGKEGKVIRSIRDLIKVLAVKQNKHVEVILAE